jgi:hypothetical protein
MQAASKTRPYDMRSPFSNKRQQNTTQNKARERFLRPLNELRDPDRSSHGGPHDKSNGEDYANAHLVP